MGAALPALMSSWSPPITAVASLTSIANSDAATRARGSSDCASALPEESVSAAARRQTARRAVEGRFASGALIVSSLIRFGRACPHRPADTACFEPTLSTHRGGRSPEKPEPDRPVPDGSRGARRPCTGQRRTRGDRRGRASPVVTRPSQRSAGNPLRPRVGHGREAPCKQRSARARGRPDPPPGGRRSRRPWRADPKWGEAVKAVVVPDPAHGSSAGAGRTDDAGRWFGLLAGPA